MKCVHTGSGRRSTPKDFKPTLDLAYRHALRFLEGAREGAADASFDQAEARRRLGAVLPECSTPDEIVIEEFAVAAEGGIVPTMGGRFFGFVIGGVHPAGVAADWLSAAWDDSPGTPLASPFGCAVDTIAGEWALELLDLPREASVGIVTGATVGNFVCICAARHALLKRMGWDVEAQGLFGAPEISVVISDALHPTVKQGLRMAGLGAERVISVATDENGSMREDSLEHALRDASDPVLVCTTAGQINTGHSDPFVKVASLLKSRNAWMHVDGAFGLWAQVSSRTKHLTKGVALADSWSVDAHKLLNSPYDGAFAIVRDKNAHAGAMSIQASYLPQPPGARDPSHFVPELSRRGRGHAIYATMKALGRQGIREAIEGLHDNTLRMARFLTREAGISCLNEVVFNQAIFRMTDRTGDAGASDRLTDAVALEVRKGGEAWFQTADWHGQRIMRCSVSDHSTTAADVDRAASAVISAYRKLA